MARPKKYNINGDEIEKLSSYGCTNNEIADFYGCSTDLIKKSYSCFTLKGRSRLKMKLRKLQWKSAEAGNVTMQIWLGKQYLMQSDKIESENNEIIDTDKIIEAFKKSDGYYI